MTCVASAPLAVDVLLDAGKRGSLAEDVRLGLLAEPRRLPPRCLYDERGSALFDRITELPEYYPARAERAILNRCAPEIVARGGTEELLELGSGVASKTRALLYAMAGAGTLRRYLPFDVDRSVVERSARELAALYPGLEVRGFVGDFRHHLRELPPPSGRRLVAFLGGTLGNLEQAERATVLGDVRTLLGPGDRLLLGADLVKDAATLLAAYDDPGGVTREFTLNALRVVNRELDADFDLGAFDPFARWEPESSRMELGVRARRNQLVRLNALGPREIEVAAGEELRTEISAKFTPEGIERELAHAQLTLERLLVDERGLFSVALAAPSGVAPEARDVEDGRTAIDAPPAAR